MDDDQFNIPFFEVDGIADPIGASFYLDRLFADEETDETKVQISPRAYRTRAKREMKRMRQKESLNDVVKRPPEPGEAVHVVAANKFNFWTWAPTIIDWLGHTDGLYCSTWTTNHTATIDLFRLMDDDLIRGTVGFVLGIYFKRREPVVYTELAEGLKRRGGWIKTIETHSKVMLLSNETTGDYFSLEGSANLTDNPRLEQITIVNDRGLYEFHKEWIEEVKTLRSKMPWP